MCSFPSCGEPFLAHGLCQSHYQQRRRGTPLRPIRKQRHHKIKRLRRGRRLNARRKKMRTKRRVISVAPYQGEGVPSADSIDHPSGRLLAGGDLDYFRYWTRIFEVAGDKLVSGATGPASFGPMGSRAWRIAQAIKVRAKYTVCGRKTRSVCTSDQYREYASRSRARRYGVEVSLYVPALSRLVESQGGLCAICDEEIMDAQLDHIVPLGSGGGHTPDNVQAACRICNNRKGKRLLPTN